jgi:DNA-binding transcriptional ArsR family regulator
MSELPNRADLAEILAALGNPIRLEIIARLVGRKKYVSQLAREMDASRPLLHMHLQRLEAAGLVVATPGLSEDGRAMKFYEAAPFNFTLTPVAIEDADSTDPTSPKE